MTQRDLKLEIEPRTEFTGERYVPEVHGNIELEHVHRYLQACQLAEARIVLEIASGETHGSEMFTRAAAKVIGIDASIEHDTQHAQMMQEFNRVLHRHGIPLISSPDKENYSVEPGHHNPFHARELYEHEFKKTLCSHFKNVRFYGQRVVFGSRMFPAALQAAIVSYSSAQCQQGVASARGVTSPMYWMALAADAQLPEMAASFLEQEIDNSEVVLGWRAELAHITGSKACRIALLFQRIRVALVSPNSKRARVVRRLLGAFRAFTRRSQGNGA